ncbi:hypothetical protein AAZX31_03G160400 [Glycine max]
MFCGFSLFLIILLLFSPPLPLLRKIAIHFCIPYTYLMKLSLQTFRILDTNEAHKSKLIIPFTSSVSYVNPPHRVIFLRYVPQMFFIESSRKYREEKRCNSSIFLIPIPHLSYQYWFPDPFLSPRCIRRSPSHSSSLLVLF